MPDALAPYWHAQATTRRRAADLADARRLVHELAPDRPLPASAWISAASIADLPADVVLAAARAADLLGDDQC